MSSKFCCSLSKQENHVNMNMNKEEWVVFASHWKSRKLLLVLLTMFCWTKVLPKKVWEAFWANPCLPRQLLAYVILECFVNFLDDPYYEPLLWFMINFKCSIVILCPASGYLLISCEYLSMSNTKFSVLKALCYMLSKYILLNLKVKSILQM